MAEAKIQIESVIHDALRDAMQRISDEYAIQVTEVRVDWVDISNAGSRRQYKVETIYAHTFSK